MEISFLGDGKVCVYLQVCMRVALATATLRVAPASACLQKPFLDSIRRRGEIARPLGKPLPPKCYNGENGLFMLFLCS